MKKYILFFLLPFLACSKDKDNNETTSSMLQGKMWVVDSSYSILNGVRTVTIPQPPTYLKIRYNTNGTYDIYASYDTPQSKKYELSGLTIFYWDASLQKDPNKFTTIQRISPGFLHTSQVKPSGEITGNFSHAE